MAHEGKRHPIAGSGNTSVAALLKKNQTNNESLFKAIASEKSHINQIGSATPDFNTVMKNYGTFSDKTWKRKVADEKARVTAFTSLDDNPSESMQTDWDPKTKLKREKAAKSQAVIEERLGQYNFNNALFRDGIETGTEVGNQTKLVAEEKGSLVLNENSGIQTTASGQHLDAIGREINQLTTDVGQESYRGLNTDEVAFAAIDAIVEDVALEKAVITKKAEYIDPHKYNRDRKDQIITNTPMHNQLHSEVTPTVEDYTISGYAQKQLKLEADTKDLALGTKQLGNATELNAERAVIDDGSPFIFTVPNDEGIEFGTATDLAVKSMDEVSTQLQADFKAQIEEENLYATATTLAQESLSDKAKKDSIRLKEKEKKEAELLAKEREIEEEIEDFENELKQSLMEDEIDRTAAATAAAVVSRETDKEIEKAIKVATAKQAEFDKIAKEKELALLRRQNETFQQNSQTYGLDGNKRLITPGNETLYIDTIADEAITGEGDTVGSLTAEIITEKADKADKAAQLQGTADIQKYLDDEQSNGKLGSTLPPQLGNGGIGYNSANKIVKTSNTATPLQQKMFDNEANYLKESGLAEQRARKETLEKLPSFADTRDGSLTGKDPFRFSTLAYPESITTDPQYGHFILFYVNVQNKTKYSYRGYNNDGDEIDVGDKYQTSKLDFVDDGSGRRPGSGGGSEYRMVVTEHTGAIEQGLASEVSYQKQQHLDGQLGSNHLRNNQVTLMKARKARAGIDTVLDLTTRITDSVAIYLPSAINDNVKAGYQDFNTGFAGFIALSGGKILRNIANNDFEGAARAFIGKGKDILLDLGKRAAIGAYGGLLSGDGVTNAFDKAFGQTVNPFIEVAFDSMGVRTFNYTFDFRPKSSRETEEVQAIIKLFRFHMVPEQKGSNHRYMTLPSTFDIHYMYQTNEASKENEFYSKIATCVLTGCDVDYTPDGVKSFESGAPTHITMTLNFMETEMLTKEKINDGF